MRPKSAPSSSRAAINDGTSQKPRFSQNSGQFRDEQIRHAGGLNLAEAREPRKVRALVIEHGLAERSVLVKRSFSARGLELVGVDGHRRERVAESLDRTVEHDAAAVDEYHVREQILDLLDLVGGDEDRARLVHVVVHEGRVEAAPREQVETKGGLVEHQQFGIDCHGQSKVHLGLHSLRQFPHPVLERDPALRQERERPLAAEPRVDAVDQIDGLIDPQPLRQHGDIGYE
jgi:hypothetical protein